MSSPRFVVRVLCFAGAVFTAACSSQSPAAPLPAVEPSLTDGTSRDEARTTAVPGTYEISFLKESIGGLQPVTDNTLNVGEFLVLKSQVKDVFGVPAVAGRVTYEYCSLNNEKVRSSECESGRGRWKRLFSMPVDPVGSLFGFGSCSTPRTIGFRFRYSGGGSIADGVSPSADVTWR